MTDGQQLQPMTPEQAVGVIGGFRDLISSMYYRVPKPLPLDQRRSLLLASILKVKAMADATIQLAAIASVEEIWSIGRTMSEVVVNAAYLQFADEIEVQRYYYFDFSNLVRLNVQLRSHVPNPVQHSPELQEQIDEMAANSKSIAGRADKDRNWSEKGLIERAQLADQNSTRKLYKMAVLTGSPYGHAAVHGTLMSLSWFLNGIARESDEPDSDRLTHLGVALHGAAFTLSVFCHAIDDMFGLGLESQIAQTGIAAACV